MENEKKTVRIKGVNSEYRWEGSAHEEGAGIKEVPSPEKLFLKLFICPSAMPGWMEPPLSNKLNRCEGTHWNCPNSIDPAGHAMITLSEHKGLELVTDGDNYLTLDQQGNTYLGFDKSVNSMKEGKIELRSNNIKFIRRYRQEITIYHGMPAGPYFLFQKPLEGTVVCIARYFDSETGHSTERQIQEGFQIDYEKNTITITDSALYAAQEIILEFGLSPDLTIDISEDNIALKFENNGTSSEIVFQGNDLHLTPGKNGKVVIKGNVSVEGNIEYTGTCAPVQPKPK